MAARALVPTASSGDPFDDINFREDVRRMLQGIKPRQQTAIVFTEILGCSSEHAAQIMRIQPATVRVLASRGRAALRKSQEGTDA